MRVAVVGCGPAGLAAVHAAVGLGAEVTIFSPGEPSPQRGPLLLQRPIPGITNDHPLGYIRQIVIGGSILDYRYKLYGDVNININGNVLQEGYHAWDHFDAYRTMWETYMVSTSPVTRIKHWMSGEELRKISRGRGCDLVVNTAPLNMMCLRGQHVFQSARVLVTPHSSYPDQPEDTIVFNAGNDYEWVRSSRIFGNEVTEWMPGLLPDTSGDVRTVHKPIRTDCNCFPHVLRTGRFGAWRNETWVDTAYYDTRNALISISRKAEWDNVR